MRHRYIIQCATATFCGIKKNKTNLISYTHTRKGHTEPPQPPHLAVVALAVAGNQIQASSAEAVLARGVEVLHGGAAVDEATRGRRPFPRRSFADSAADARREMSAMRQIGGA